MKQGWAMAMAGGCLLLVGCQKPALVAPAPETAVNIRPGAAVVTVGRSLPLRAEATGEAGLLQWQVLEPGGGSVDGGGRYQAPSQPGTYTVQVRTGSGNASARARIEVVAAPDGNISAPARVQAGAVGLEASVPAGVGSRYQWSVAGGQLLAGDGSDRIRFEAGPGPKVLIRCRISNAAGDAVNSLLEIPVAAPVTLSISPRETILTVGRSMKFGFDLRGGLGADVQWSVAGAGQVDAKGGFTAPAEPGWTEVRVTALDDPGQVAVARVKVVPEPAGVLVAPTQVTAGAAELSASITAQPGLSYAWEITGGACLGSRTEPSLRFTAGAGPKLVLSCLISNEAGDSLRVSRTLTVSR